MYIMRREYVNYYDIEMAKDFNIYVKSCKCGLYND